MAKGDLAVVPLRRRASGAQMSPRLQVLQQDIRKKETQPGMWVPPNQKQHMRQMIQKESSQTQTLCREITRACGEAKKAHLKSQKLANEAAVVLAENERCEYEMGICIHKLRELNVALSEAKELILQRKQAIGSDRLHKEKEARATKGVLILERKLHAALMKRNYLLTTTQSLRKKLENERRDRALLDAELKFLEQRRVETSLMVGMKAEEADVISDKFTKAQMQMAKVAKDSDKYFGEVEKKWIHLSDLAELDAEQQEQKLLRSRALQKRAASAHAKSVNNQLTGRSNASPRPGTSQHTTRRHRNAFLLHIEEDDVMAKQATANWRVASDIAAMRKIGAQVSELEYVLGTIAAATSLTNIDDLVARFEESEVENFHLFTEVNSLSTEIEMLENEIASIQNELETFQMTMRPRKPASHVLLEQLRIVEEKDKRLQKVESDLMHYLSEFKGAVERTVSSGSNAIRRRQDPDADVSYSPKAPLFNGSQQSLSSYLSILERHTMAILGLCIKRKPARPQFNLDLRRLEQDPSLREDNVTVSIVPPSFADIADIDEPLYGYDDVGGVFLNKVNANDDGDADGNNALPAI